MDTALANVMQEQFRAHGHLASISYAYSSMAPKGNGVRSWGIDDWDSFWSIAQRTHAKSQYGEFCKPHKLEVWNTLLRLQFNPKLGHVFVSCHMGEVKGFLIATKQPYWWNPSMVYATEMSFCSTHRGHGKLLLESLEDWAFCQSDIKQIELDIASGIHPRATAKLYESCGYERRGFVFIKRKP